MLLKEVQQILQANIVAGEEYIERNVETCFGSDLMSDVLAFTKCNTLLLTGLTNVQVIRTASMTELGGVVIVRGKKPPEDFLQFAATSGFTVLSTEMTMFEASGRLYMAGLRACVPTRKCERHE